jgi:hypothetical protein
MNKRTTEYSAVVAHHLMSGGNHARDMTRCDFAWNI